MKENRLSLIYILIAYAFSYIMHLYWLSWASKYPDFLWHGQVMINNVDGYFYGSGAQKILSNLHEFNPRLNDVWHYGTAVISAYLAKFLHISIDTLMLYLPAIISSFVVIPIILIGKLYKNTLWGFLAAIIGSIGWSYYNRTLAGYYDTDMFSASLPMFILYFLLASIKNRSLNHLLVASFIVIVYPFLYEQGLSIIYAIGIVSFVYLLFTKNNTIQLNLKDEFVLKFIIIFSVALLDINWIIRAILLVLLKIIFSKKECKIKNLQIASVIFFVLFLITGNVFGIILHKIFSYSTSTTTYEGLHFLNVNKTVREAGHIPWNIVFNRIIGSSVGIFIAIIGYVLLVKKYKEFIIALPLWGIGFFAFIGGLRFTVYAVYFFFYLSEKLKVKNEKLMKLIPFLGSVFLIAPNITHIVGCCKDSLVLAKIKKIYPLSSPAYLTPTTFNAKEVKVLDKLSKIATSKDYVITWWDYGYPIWYYSKTNTLIDGGKHNEDNFLVSKILTTSSQLLARNLSLISIKKYIDTNKTVALNLFIKDKKPIDVNEYLYNLEEKKYDLKLNRDIFLMLPYRMFNIFPTVAMFSNRDLNSGIVYRNHFFYKNRINQKGNILYIGQIAIDLSKAKIILNNKLIPIKEFNVVAYKNNKKIAIRRSIVSNNGLNVIILQSYGEAFILDDYYYNSVFVQLFIFENYDKNLFEPVILNPLIKIYKIK